METNSSSRFITNKEKSVDQIITSVVAKSKAMDFLVGYFFFSGYSLIAPSIGDKKLRILVGLDAEVVAEHYIREYEEISLKKNTDSKQTFRKNNWDSIVEGINNADILDNKESVETYRIFKEKLINGTLEVRKTKEPNHSKMYVFHSQEKDDVNGLEMGKIIVGSSNFSYQGLKGRNEINLYLQDGHDYDDGKKIFEELWKDSVPLVDSDTKDDFLTFIKEHTWLEIVPSPFLMYVRVLYEYFKTSTDVIRTPREITRDRLTEFFDVSYQTDAIREGLYKIRKHSGCIVADVVGLGKSVIASAIAANLNLSTIIVCPPHLQSQWQEYAEDFGLRGLHIYTPGKLEEAALNNKRFTNQLIIIDEAHRYRNENTAAYGFLHQLCAGNKVMLLSATPFNNRPEDIFSLIKLFQIPSHSTIQTVNDLGVQMAALVTEYKKLKKLNRDKKLLDKEFNKQATELAEEIRAILDPVVIRRTRVDLEKLGRYKADLKAQNIQFAKVNPPKSLEYELGELSELYTDTLEKITEKFIAARYKPLTYLKDDKAIVKKYVKHFEVENFMAGQRNMATFAKQLFVRRFESCKYSFLRTVEKMLSSMESMKDWYEKLKKVPLYKKGKMPDFETLESFVETDDTSGSLFDSDELLQTALSSDLEKGLVLIDAKDLKEDFIKELDSDISLFKDFLANWNKVKGDPKLDETIKRIKKSQKDEPNRKIIIFTEFSDTADYLFEEFKKKQIRVDMYSSKVAGKGKREELRLNFDAGYPENIRRNDFDVLVATDAISEGMSLHRAGTIYNYDIPYNPTRVIQRVGRINRINKKVFDELYIYNFFPTVTGEEVSHTQEISTFKMKLFEAILGSDTQILTADETLEGYLGKQFTEAENETDKESWDVPFRNELDTIQSQSPEILEAAKNLPYRARIARSNKTLLETQQTLFTDSLFADLDSNGVVLFSKKGDSYRFAFTDKSGKTAILQPQNALSIFKASKDEKSLEVSDSFYALYEKAKNDSGIVRKSHTNSKTAQESQSVLQFIKQHSQNESDKEYISSVMKVLSLDSLPLYYQKQIKNVDAGSQNAVQEIKAIIPEVYLDSLIEKDNKIGSEAETILLAEELTGELK
ncbi:MAG: hypothetical protein K6G00_09310 [Treponema sp.]|nr:hypothetical protein [Treponema sp.]